MHDNIELHNSLNLFYKTIFTINMSSRLEKLKKQIELTGKFLEWSRKMKAKPSKCV